MDKDLAKQFRDMAIETGTPLPQRNQFDVTVSNRSDRPLVLTSKAVPGYFDEAPVEGHVLRPGGSDAFRVTSVCFPWESGVATIMYRLADTPVNLTVTGAPSWTRAAGAVVKGRGAEEFACAVGTTAGATVITLEQVPAEVQGPVLRVA
ncbi:hypothetical protein ACTVZO_00600 [Streptomyces sp. IBSNAI002]|uniref:hypothetical protein n=1 Tax=Streptomyces sp. IBSNAI002 TaxID=3457500 RepID=UPI003FD29956